MEGQEPAPETHVTVQETIAEEPEEDPAAESVTVRCIHTLLGIPIEYFKLGVIFNNYLRPIRPVPPPSLLRYRPDGSSDG